jgi:hypothetical protein
MKKLIVLLLAACVEQAGPLPAPQQIPLAGSAMIIDPSRPALWGATTGEVCATVAELACKGSPATGCEPLMSALCCGGPIRPSCDGLTVAPTQAAWNLGWEYCVWAIEHGDGAACYGVYGALPN